MKDYQVIIEFKNKKTSSGRIIDGIIHLRISSLLNKQEQQLHIDKLTEKLIKKITWAKKYSFGENDGIVQRNRELKRLADTINDSYYKLPLEDIVFHKQESTWGTCSRKTRCIYISSRLVGAPMDLMWYIITHELCHLAEPSHNKNFWALVSKACPNYKECRNKLKAFGYR